MDSEEADTLLDNEGKEEPGAHKDEGAYVSETTGSATEESDILELDRKLPISHTREQVEFVQG